MGSALNRPPGRTVDASVLGHRVRSTVPPGRPSTCAPVVGVPAHTSSIHDSMRWARSEPRRLWSQGPMTSAAGPPQDVQRSTVSCANQSAMPPTASNGQRSRETSAPRSRSRRSALITFSHAEIGGVTRRPMSTTGSVSSRPSGIAAPGDSDPSPCSSHQPTRDCR